MSAARETGFAKLNLALHVRERLPDGYHRIETIFAFAEDGDVLEGESFEAETTGVSLAVEGPFAGGLSGDEHNSVESAWTALTSRSDVKHQSFLRLDKCLPVAAGIGGGSADAAAALRLLNRLWGLGKSAEELEEIGRGLGADVPASIRSEPARGEGKGDELERVELGLSGTPALLINPRVELATADVFARWDGNDRGALGDWRNGRNDLEQPAKAIVPQIAAILAWLSAQGGAEFVRMSGSGATCFALFGSDADRDAAAMAVPREWWHLATRLR